MVVPVTAMVVIVPVAMIVVMDQMAMIPLVAVVPAIANAQRHGWPFSRSRSSSESADRMMVVFSSSTFLYDSSVRRKR